MSTLRFLYKYEYYDITYAYDTYKSTYICMYNFARFLQSA